MQEETQPPFEQEEVPALTAAQAHEWRRRNPSIPLWLPLKTQGLLVAVALVVYLIERNAVTASLFWGALSAALPAALSVFGYTVTQRILLNGQGASYAMLGLMAIVFWEAMKLLLSVALLLLVSRLLTNVNWLALLVSFVFVVKVYWLALLLASIKRKRHAGKF